MIPAPIIVQPPSSYCLTALGHHGNRGQGNHFPEMQSCSLFWEEGCKHSPTPFSPTIIRVVFAKPVVNHAAYSSLQPLKWNVTELAWNTISHKSEQGPGPAQRILHSFSLSFFKNKMIFKLTPIIVQETRGKRTVFDGTGKQGTNLTRLRHMAWVSMSMHTQLYGPDFEVLFLLVPMVSCGSCVWLDLAIQYQTFNSDPEPSGKATLFVIPDSIWWVGLASLLYLDRGWISSGFPVSHQKA